MKRYSKEEIDGARDYFKSKKFPEVEVIIDGRRFSYFVLPQSLEPKLLHFVYRCTGDKEDGFVLGISESVKEEFRKYAVLHEFIEFREIKIGTQGRCRSSLEEELKLVPEDIKDEYVELRRGFFRDLIPYCQSQPEHYTKEDLDEFRQSLSLLEKLV